MYKTILFMDNDANYLDVHSRLLEQAGYHILQANTIQKAKTLLKGQHVHAAIFDMRMEEDDDPQDISGLTLAQAEAYQAIPKIILTAFPSYEYARQALGLTDNGFASAVDFIGKDEDPQEILMAVKKLFARNVRRNWNLSIHWRNQLSFAQLGSLINSHVKDSTVLDETKELEDLFRHLFYDCDQVTVSRVLTRRKGRIALTVFTFSEDGDRNQCIVVCGRREIIQAEDETYHKYAPKLIGGGGTIQLASAQTLHFAATVYSVIRGSLEEITTLAEFYRRNTTEQVIQALNHLFGTTLGLWYRQAGYGKENKTLKSYLQSYFDLDQQSLTLESLKQQLLEVYQNSLEAGLHEMSELPRKLITALTDFEPISDALVRYGTSPGDLNGDNILVDPEGRTWLIDFSQVSYGPLMRDFLSLETAIKADLLDIVNVGARSQLEHILINTKQINELTEFEMTNADIQKATVVISCIRQHAALIVGSDIQPYQTGSFFYALKRLTEYDPTMWYTQSELMPYFHNLLSAGLLYQQLTPSPSVNAPDQALHSLWINEKNREVWLEGNIIELSPTEYSYLLYLYQNAGQLCTYDEIATHVFETAYGQDVTDWEKENFFEQGNHHTVVGRIRKKISDTSSTHKYITTARSQGYRFNPKPS